MTPYRSAATTQGRRMAGARALWRATGIKTEDFQKPIVAMGHDGMLYSLPIPSSAEREINP